MTGNSVRGARGFVPKEGVNFDTRCNIWFHSDEVEQASRYRKPDEAFADYVRAALREKLLRDSHK